MGVSVSRSTEALRFDTGIGNASFAEVIGAPGAEQGQKPLLPGSTTVTQAIDGIFPTGRDVETETMNALVAGNPATLRTSTAFADAARGALGALEERATPAAAAAAREIETLLADADLFERYRLALLET